MALGAQATNDIKETTGIHEAMLGERSNEKSGRAIRERKAQSATGTQVWADNYEIAIECAGKILVSLIPHVYGHAEAAIVLDENLERAYLQQLRGTMVLKDNNEEAYEEPIDLNVGQYQVKVAVGPTFASQREEAQSFIIDTMQALPPEVAGIIAPLVVKYSDQPGSDEIMNEMAPVVEALKIRMGVGGPEAQSQLQAMAMQSTMQALVQLQIIPPEMAEQLMQQMAGGGQQGAEGEVA